jgi:hypothetical protein
MRILIDVVDAGGIEAGAAAHDTVHGVAFGQQEFAEIGTILASDSDDERGSRQSFSSRSSIGLLLDENSFEAFERAALDPDGLPFAKNGQGSVARPERRTACTASISASGTGAGSFENPTIETTLGIVRIATVF